MLVNLCGNRKRHLLWNDGESAYDGALFGPGSEIRPQMGHPFPGPVVDGRSHPTAQANLFALYSGIVPTERIASVRKWVLNHLDEVREPMSHYYFFQMLYRMEDKTQDEMVVQRMRSQWKNQVEFGVADVVGRSGERRWIEGPYLRHASWLLSDSVRVRSTKSGAGGAASDSCRAALFGPRLG